jgi:hypothetical protein
MAKSDPNDELIEANISHLRQMYAEGTLQKWKIARLERIPGWSWKSEPAKRQKKNGNG